MTHDEFTGGMGALISAIGRSFTDPQIAVWWDCTKDLDASPFHAAIKRFACEADSGFPSIAKIRRYAVEAVHGVPETAAEAWGRVLDAIRRFGYLRPREAHAALGELIWKSLGNSSGWAILCESDKISVSAGQFRGAYEALAAIELTQLVLPVDVRPRARIDVIESTARRLEVD